MTVHFDNPPLVEVVCGVHFQYLSDLLAPHYGVLWEHFKDEGYTDTREAPPLAPTSGTIEFSDVPPLPRIWFTTPDGQRLIQVQRDRLLFNWRRTEGDHYPHFDEVYETFLDHFGAFRTFLDSIQIEDDIEPLEYELTYVNHIPLEGKLSDLSEIGELFPDFCWRHEDHPPEDINWRTILSLPEKRGRLLVSLRNKKRTSDGQSILALKLSAKGMHEDPDLLTSMEEWFDSSHDTVVELFTKVTSQMVQTEQWGKDSDG